MMVTFWIGERNSFTIVIIIIFCMYSGHSLDWFISSGCHLVILYGKTESVCEVVIVWHVVSKSVYMMLFLSWIKTRDLCTGIFESLYRKKGSLVEQCEPHLSFSIFFYGFLVESLKSKTASFILSWQRSFFLRWSNNSSGCSYIRVILSDWLV